jgi:tryptophanyl-tRNA synthetase
MSRIVGVRPSGEMHIGHYASVIKPALTYADVDVLIAKYHAEDDHVSYTKEMLRNFGIEGKVQEIDVDLYFRLLKATPSNLLNAMPQYKAKSKTAHMYTYPVLMAHDLVGYDEVIVGEDQRPHIEFANDLFERVNLPRIEGRYVGGRIMGLRDPSKKMSSSEPETCLFLYDQDVEKKVRRAVTTPEGRKNLESIYAVLGGVEPPEKNSDLKTLIIDRFKSL